MRTEHRTYRIQCPQYFVPKKLGYSTSLVPTYVNCKFTSCETRIVYSSLQLDSGQYIENVLKCPHGIHFRMVHIEYETKEKKCNFVASFSNNLSAHVVEYRCDLLCPSYLQRHVHRAQNFVLYGHAQSRLTLFNNDVILYLKTCHSLCAKEMP